MTACVKCGSDDLHVVYHKKGCDKPHCSCTRCDYGSHSKEHEEHLHYSCRRCRFDWTGPLTPSQAAVPLPDPVSSGRGSKGRPT